MKTKKEIKILLTELEGALEAADAQKDERTSWGIGLQIDTLRWVIGKPDTKTEEFLADIENL